MYVRRNGIVHSSRIVFEPPCNCFVCKQQYRELTWQKRRTFAYHSALSDQEANQKSMEFVETTRANLQYLHEQCEANGPTILKRWKKKSAEKRKDLLLEVDPTIYPFQWSDIRFTEGFFYQPILKAYARDGVAVEDIDPDITQGHFRRPYRNVCFLPYLNLESLTTDPARFLNLLYNRVKYTPQQWAPFDDYLLEKQWKVGSFSTLYNKNCITMYGSDYGKLTSWKESSVHSLDIMGFPRAILVLEAQIKLSEVLKGIVKKLVEGVENQVTSADFDQTLEIGLKKSTGKSNCVEFAATFINQPFTAPPIFNVQSLLNIAQEQANLHADHLWLLQTDSMSLRQYSALVIDGTHRESLTIHNQKVFAAMKLMEDAMTFWIWDWILQEVQKISDLSEIFKDSIHRGGPLPPAYAQSLGSLEALLLHFVHRSALATYKLLPFRPGFQTKWNTESIQRLQTVVYKTPTRADKIHNIIELFGPDRLEFCLMSLSSTLTSDPNAIDDDTEYKFHEPSEIFALLDDHLSKTTKADMSRLDETIYSSYSDLSALHQMLSMVRLHRPRVSKVPSFEEAKKSSAGKAWRYSRANYLEQDHRNFDKKTNTENPQQKIDAQQRLGNLMKDFLNTARPSGNRASQKWLDQDEEQRKASGLLWAEMRNRHRQTLERIQIGEADIQDDLKVLYADIAPEHIANLEKERAAILAQIAANTEASRKSHSKGEIQTQWGEDNLIDVSVPRNDSAKVKTRPEKVENAIGLLTITNPSDEIDSLGRQNVPIFTDNQQEVPKSSDSAWPLRKICVNKRAIDILQALFPKPNFEERTKSVDWASFVAAMAEAGFAARQLHGSEYAFEPAEAGQGKIIFHKPHPEPKYDAIRLLGIGKRMNKWFGWDANTFELAKK